MTDPDPLADGSAKSGSVGKILVAGLALVGLAAAIYLASGGRNVGGGGSGGGVSPELQQSLDLTRTALAATENLEMVEADQAWNPLYQQSPQDESVSLNRAINRVLLVDDLSGKATSASLKADQKKAARAQLPDAISNAREAISEYAATTDDSVMPMWLKTRIDLHEASLLPGSMTKSLRKEVYQRLSEAIRGDLGKIPDAMVLGGSLIQVVEQLEDPIDGLPDDLLADAAETVGVLSNHHTDNLFFALRAARLNISTKNALAAQFVKRANQLAQAIEPSIRRETKPIGVTPDELVAQIIQAIESGNWSEAENRMLLWFNVLNSTEIVKTDRRRASPHPLDRLSFDSLRRLSAEVVAASPLNQGSTEFVFESNAIAESAGAVDVQSIDFDLDLDRDLVSVNDAGVLQLWENDGQGNWSAAGQLELGMQATGLIATDLFLVDSSNPDRLRAESKSSDDQEQDFGAAVRHNTFASLVAYGKEGVRLIQVDGRASTAMESRLKLVEGDTGLGEIRGVLTAVAGDLEADGDLDLVFATESDGVRMFANRGNRTFFEIGSRDQAFGTDDPVTAMEIADLDRDLDLDIVTTHAASGHVGMLENLLHLQFRGRLLEEIPAIEGASSIAIEDVDGNVSWDLVVGGSGGVAIVFSQTADANAWTVDHIETSQQAEASGGMLVADLDNDSWMEVLRNSSTGATISRIGPWGFGDWQAVASAPKNGPMRVGDFDLDGRVDLASVQENIATCFMNRNDTGFHYLDVRFKGIDDNASGRVNHYAIGSVVELRFGPHYRARIVRSPSTHFGLDGFDTSSSIRAILPNGLTQTIRDPKVDSLVEEEQTLKGSCPYLYAWDGEKYVFMTDCLWAAPLGLQVARGVVAKDRPWEYLKIDGEGIKPRDGKYDFRITEELWEVAYFDKVALTVVDHPADVEVWTNEKVGPPDIATPTIFAFGSDQLRSVVSAVDTRGRNVTEKLKTADRDFVQGFDYRLRQGLCEPHWIDLDFGDALLDGGGVDDPKAFLVMTGWILPTDTSLNIQIDQNPDLSPIEFPSVWVPDANQREGWRNAIPFMGFPGGKTKTIVVDVTEAMNRQDPRFRIRTSAQIYWDCAQIAIQSEPATFRTMEVDLLSAEVAFHGFSKRIRRDSTLPETYDYQQSTQAARWPPLRGNVTRFGDCHELIREWDDSMVVISSGDEIRLEFDVPEAAPPAGWKRDFILHSIGWDKDADLNTLSGQSIGPLPFRGMTQYPPQAGETAKTRQLERMNREHLQRSQAFRSFWYRQNSPGPSRFLDGATAVR